MPYPPGHCKGCGDPNPIGSRCASCSAIRKAEATTLRNYRREHGLCLTCGELAALVPGKRAVRRSHCKRHLAYYAARQRRAG